MLFRARKKPTPLAEKNSAEICAFEKSLTKDNSQQLIEECNDLALLVGTLINKGNDAKTYVITDYECQMLNMEAPEAIAHDKQLHENIRFAEERFKKVNTALQAILKKDITPKQWQELDAMVKGAPVFELLLNRIAILAERPPVTRSYFRCC